MKWVRWFIAGALAVPLFHQVVLLLLNVGGFISRAPYSMAPTKPFGVPQVISLSFFGGLWGIVLGLVLARIRARTPYWVVAILFGAIAPSLVAMFVAAPLKGQPVPATPQFFAIALLVNAAWGLGTALLYQALSGRRRL